MILVIDQNHRQYGKGSGYHAVIASDQAVIHYASSVGMEVHISTQLNVTNVETVKFYSLFADTMVLSVS